MLDGLAHSVKTRVTQSGAVCMGGQASTYSVDTPEALVPCDTGGFVHFSRTWVFAELVCLPVLDERVYVS